MLNSRQHVRPVSCDWFLELCILCVHSLDALQPPSRCIKSISRSLASFSHRYRTLGVQVVIIWTCIHRHAFIVHGDCQSFFFCFYFTIANQFIALRCQMSVLTNISDEEAEVDHPQLIYNICIYSSSCILSSLQRLRVTVVLQCCSSHPTPVVPSCICLSTVVRQCILHVILKKPMSVTSSECGQL